MSATFSELLFQWHRLSVQESAAIRAHDWKTVAACQESKAGLQPGMDACAGRAPLTRETRTLVDELTALEMKNRDWLQEQLSIMRRRKNELEGSARNLKRVRSSYGSCSSANWQSYS